MSKSEGYKKIESLLAGGAAQKQSGPSANNAAAPAVTPQRSAGYNAIETQLAAGAESLGKGNGYMLVPDWDKWSDYSNELRTQLTNQGPPIDPRWQAAIDTWAAENAPGEEAYGRALDKYNNLTNQYEAAMHGTRPLDLESYQPYVDYMAEAESMYPEGTPDRELLLAAERDWARNKFSGEMLNGPSSDVRYLDQEKIDDLVRQREEAGWILDYATENRYADVPLNADFAETAAQGRTQYEDYRRRAYTDETDQERAERAHAEAVALARETTTSEEAAEWFVNSAMEDFNRQYAYDKENASIWDPRYNTEYQEPDERWSEDERKTYYYLFATDKDRANQYALGVNNRYDAEAADERKKQVGADATKSVWAGTVRSITSILDHLLASGWDTARMVAETGYRGNAYQSQYMGRSLDADNAQAAIAEELNNWSKTIPENIPIIGGKGAGDVYQMFMSVGESLASVSVGAGVPGFEGMQQVASLKMFFDMASASGMRQSLQKGNDGLHAVYDGFARGAAEVLGEVVSVDRLVKEGGVLGLLRHGFLKNMAIQGGIEGAEEIFTGILNNAFDQWHNGAESEFWTSVYDRQRQGMDAQTALKEATKQYVYDTLYEGLVGALSGAISIGGKTAIPAIRETRTTYQGNAQDLIDLTRSRTEEGSRTDRAAQRAQARLDKKGNLNNLSADRMKVLLAEEMSPETKFKSLAQVNAYMDELSGTPQGLIGEAGAHSSAEARRSFVQRNLQTMQLDENAMKILLDGYEAGQASPSNYVLGVREAYNAGRIGLSQEQIVQNGKYAGALNETQREHAWTLGQQNKIELPETEAQATEAREETKLGPVDASTEEGKEALNTRLSPLGEHAAAAAAVYESGQDAGDFAEAMNKAAALYAASGADLQAVVQQAREGKTSDIVGMLTDAQVEAATQIGQQIRAQQQAAVQDMDARYRRIREQAAAINAESSADAQTLRDINAAIREANKTGKAALEQFNAQLQALDEMVKADPEAENSEAFAKAYDEAKANKEKALEMQKAIQKLEKQKKAMEGKKPVQRKKGTVSFDGGNINGTDYAAVDRESLTRQQKNVVAMVERLADFINLDYVFFDGPSNQGGVYLKGGTVYLNINAGMTQAMRKSMAAASLSHELTHFMQEYAPKEYQELKDYVVSAILNKDAAEFDRLVKQQMKWEPGKSYAELTDELVANACQTMLTDDRAVQRMARSNMSLAQRVADVLDDITEKIRAAFDGLSFDDNRAIFAPVRAVMHEIEGITERWADGISAAVENYNAVQTVKQQKPGQEAVSEAVLASEEASESSKNAAKEGGVQYQAWSGGELERIFIPYSDETAREKAFADKAQSLLSRGKVVTLIQAEVSQQTTNTDWSSLPTARKYLRKTLQALFGENSVRFVDRGTVVEAYLTKDGRKHTAGAITSPLEAAALAKAHELIDKAEYVFSAGHDVHSTKGKNVSSNTTWDYFEAVAKLGEMTLPVRFMLRDVTTDVREQIYKIGVNEEGASHNNRVPKTGRLVDQETPSEQSIADVLNNSKPQFQMMSEVEATDKLVAVHNVSEDKLLSALKLGGLPMPSIAIVKTKTGHTMYGPISLVFGREAIDPRSDRRNKVYGADAWTPTGVRIDYQLDADGLNALEAQLQEASQRIADGIFSSSSAIRSASIETTTTFGLEEAVDKLAKNETVLAAYAAENGIDVEPVYEPKSYSNYGNETLQDYIDIAGEEQVKAIHEQFLSGDWDLSPAEIRPVKDALIKKYMAYKSFNGKQITQERAEKRASMIEQGDKAIHFIEEAYQMLTDEDKTGNRISRWDTLDALKAKLNGKDVKGWLREKMGSLYTGAGIFNGKDMFYPDGRRRTFKQTHDAVTLANIVKNMAQNQSARGQGAHFGATGIQSITSQDFQNIDQMKQASGRLARLSEEEYSAAVKAVDERLERIVNDICQENGDNTYMAREIVREAILETARGSKTVAAVQRFFREETEYKISPEQAQTLLSIFNDAANLPTEYFEAKPQRAVGFDEVRAAIIPSTASGTLRNALTGAGVQTIEYTAGDEAARLRAVQSVPDVQFQTWDDTTDDTAAEGRERERAYARLQSENAILAETVAAMRKLSAKQDNTIEKLQNRLRLTKTAEVRESDARKLARSLIKEHNSRADAEPIASQLKTLGDYILQTKTEEISEETLKGRARAIAAAILEGAYETMDVESEVYREITEAIKGKKLSIDEDFLGELDEDGGYNAFRKRNFGRFTLAKRESAARETREGYLSVDQFYTDLQGEYGKTFFPDVANEGEQVRILAQRAEAGQTMEVNPYSQYMGEATEELANRIVMDAMRGVMRQTAPTTADRQKARTQALRDQIQQLKAENKLDQREAASLYQTIYDLSVALDRSESKYTTLRKEADYRVEQVRREGTARAIEAKAKERARAAEDLADLKEHYKEIQARARERRENTGTRRKIRKLIDELNARLKSPTEKRHIPRELVQLSIDVLEMIDLDNGRSASLTERLAEIRTMYEGYRQNPTYAAVYDPVTAEMLQNLAQTVGTTKLLNMSQTQLDAVYEALKSLNYVIHEAIRVKVGNEERLAYEMAQEMTQETRQIPKAQKGWLKGKYLAAHLRADVAFRCFAGFKKNSTWETMARILNDGQLKQTELQMRLSIPFAQLLADEQGLADFTAVNTLGSVKQDKLVDIGLKDESGEAILVSHDLMMGIYMDLLNEDNRRHFIRGGKTMPNLKDFYNGKGGFGFGTRRAVGIAEQLSEAYHELDEARRGSYGDWQEQAQARVDALLAEGERYADSVKAAIEANMTEFDRKWLRATQQLMDVESKRYLNETTLEVYGIEKARVEHYFPITTDPNFLGNANFESITKDMSLENAGFMKERVPASNPTLALGVAGVVTNQINRVAQYCGLMPAIRNFNKVYNKIGSGYSDSLKKAVSDTFGKAGQQYIENLMADLTGSRSQGEDVMGLNKAFAVLRGNLAQATLTLNPRVALAQAASFPTAAAELGYAPLVKAFFRGGRSSRMISRADTELIAKYSPLLWLRMQGYSSTELGDIKNSNRLSSKVFKKLRWFTGWIQAVDGATVGRLWYAAEYWVQANQPSLEKGSEAYYEAVAQKFNAVVEKTQPNYTPMQRAAILREPDGLLRTFTMFMTQRLQNFNILYDSTASYQKARADLANNRNGVTRADVAEARTDMLRAVSSQVAQATVFVAFKLLADGLLHNVKAYRDDDTDELTGESVSLKLLDNFMDAFIGAFLGGSEMYGIFKGATGMSKWYGLSLSGVDSLNDAINDLVALAGTEYDLNNEKDRAKFYGQIWKTAKDLCVTLGLPITNAEKIYNGLRYHVEDIINGEFLSFEAGSESTKTQNANRIIRALESGAGVGGKKGGSIGQYGKGNIDLFDRDTGLYDRSGDLMTVKSISFEEDGMEILVPTIVKKNGKWVELSAQAAIDWYHRTGEYLGKFKTVAEADAYADKLHLQQAGLYGDGAADSSAVQEAIAAFDSEQDALTAVKARLKTMYNDGEMTEAGATRILSQLGMDKTDIYWTVRSWEGEDKYTEIKAAALAGNKTDFNAEMKQLTENGVKEKDVISSVKSFVKKVYLGDDLSEKETEAAGGKTLSAAEARKLLAYYCGLSVDEANETVAGWDFKKKYGFEYIDRKTAYLEGDISQSQLRGILTGFGGKSADKANEEILTYDYEKKYGLAWSERKASYLNGKISRANMVKALQTYGGYAAEKAEEEVAAWDWAKGVPGADSISTAAIQKYNTYCAKAGVDKATYVQAWKAYNETESDKDEKGETIQNSKMKKVMPQINALPISAAEKTAIALCFYSQKNVSKYKLW